MAKQESLRNKETPESILGIASAFRKSKMLLTACELDLFTILGDKQLSSKDIAFELNTDERATDRLLNGLCAIHFLNKEANKFSNTEGGKKYLSSNGSEFLGDMMQFTHSWETWGDLTETVKRGVTKFNKSINDKSDEWVEKYVDSLHRSYTHEAVGVAQQIDFRNVKTVLDLGAGSGLYTIEFLKLHPELEITVFDFPKVVERSKKYLQEAGLLDRVNLLSGDFFVDDIGKHYDLVFASFVCDEYSIWDNIKLMRRANDSLNFKGSLIIHDSIINDDRYTPESSALYSLNMLLNTEKGDAYTTTDYWVLLKESGYFTVEKFDTNFNTSLVIGKK
jgi:tRNA A58 N-methylase Trm61